MDWDFILKVTMHADTSYLPSQLVDYCNRRSRERITTMVTRGPEDLAAIRNRYLKQMGNNNNLDAREPTW